MNSKLVYLVVLLTLTSVYSVSSIDDDDNDRNDYTEAPQVNNDNDTDTTIVDSTTVSSAGILEEDDDDDDDDADFYKARIRILAAGLSITWSYFENHWTSESNTTVSEEIGPKFRTRQLCGLLKQDIKKAYQTKCSKISGDENLFDELVNGTEELRNCSEEWLNLQYETIENAKKTKDFKSVAMTFCQKREELFDCVNDFNTLKQRCSFPSEIEKESQWRKIFKSIANSVCSNGGADLASLVSRDGDGRKCITINKDEIKTCRNKAAYTFLKRILTKFIESEHFEFKMNNEDCKAFDDVSDCFVSSVENCLDPAAKNQFTSMFTLFREQTSCATLT